MKKKSKAINSYFDLLNVTVFSKVKAYITLARVNKYIRSYVYNVILLFTTISSLIYFLTLVPDIRISIVGAIISLFSFFSAKTILKTVYGDYLGPILESDFSGIFTEGSFCTLRYGTTKKFQSYSFSFEGLTKVVYYSNLGLILVTVENVLHKSKETNAVIEEVELEIPLNFQNYSDVLHLFKQYTKVFVEKSQIKYYSKED